MTHNSSVENDELRVPNLHQISWDLLRRSIMADSDGSRSPEQPSESLAQLPSYKGRPSAVGIPEDEFELLQHLRDLASAAPGEGSGVSGAVHESQ
jgi:hypothetical protein